MNILDPDVDLPNEYPISLKHEPTQDDINYCLSLNGVTSARPEGLKILYTTDGSIDPESVNYQFRRFRPR